jgi:hypothetical protein
MYLKACDSVSAARADIAEYLHWYKQSFLTACLTFHHR